MKRYLVIAAAVAGFVLIAWRDDVIAAAGVFLLAAALRFD